MLTVKFSAAAELGRLQKLSTAALRGVYIQVFGKTPITNNRSFLFKRIALRIQQPGAAEALARGKAVPEPAAPPAPLRDPRLPSVGTILTRPYKGRDLKVLITADGFEFEGTRYRSLSAIARRVAGVAWNGYGFFGLLTTGKAV